MSNESDGIAGTDNISVLFPEKPSAAPLLAQPEVVVLLEELATLAATGKITGIIVLAFTEVGADRASITGKVSFRDGVTALEQMKFGILARDYSQKLIQPT